MQCKECKEQGLELLNGVSWSCYGMDFAVLPKGHQTPDCLMPMGCVTKLLSCYGLLSCYTEGWKWSRYHILLVLFCVMLPHSRILVLSVLSLIELDFQGDEATCECPHWSVTNLALDVHYGDINMTLCHTAGQSWSEGDESSHQCFGGRLSSVWRGLWVALVHIYTFILFCI